MKKGTIIVGICAFILGVLATVTVPRYFQKSEVDITNMNQAPSAPSQSGIEAITRLESLLNGDPSNIELLQELGNAYFDNGQFDRAKVEYEKVVEKNPNDPNVITDLGICWRNLGNPEQAVKKFEEASRIAPSHINSRYNAGVVYYYDLKDYVKAKEAWQAYVAIAQNDPRTEEIKKILQEINNMLSAKQ